MFGNKNIADVGMPYLNQAQERYEPYAKRGEAAYGPLNDIYSQMMSNPGEYLANISKDYQQSPGLGFKMDEMLKAAGGAAAAGGMRGNMGDIQNEGRLAEMLMGDDFQSWLNNVMGINKQGIAGQQGFYDQGYNANDNIANILSSKGNLAMKGQEQKNEGMSKLAALIPALIGGVVGFGAGGPMGAIAGGTAGYGLGKSFF